MLGGPSLQPGYCWAWGDRQSALAVRRVKTASACAHRCRAASDALATPACAAVGGDEGLGSKYSNLGQLKADAKPLLSPQVRLAALLGCLQVAAGHAWAPHKRCSTAAEPPAGLWLLRERLRRRVDAEGERGGPAAVPPAAPHAGRRVPRGHEHHTAGYVLALAAAVARIAAQLASFLFVAGWPTARPAPHLPLLPAAPCALRPSHAAGQRLRCPILVAPMAQQRLCHPDGELAMARAAAACGVPYILSTMATASIQEVAAAVAAPSADAHLWFQAGTRSLPLGCMP